MRRRSRTYHSRRPRLARLWDPIRRLFERPQPPPGDLPEPPDDEPALVGRRPRMPLNSGSVALEPPHEPDDLDARGQEG